MAYSPIEQGSLPEGGALDAVARRHGSDRFAMALAWVLSRQGVIAIPKASDRAHVAANRRAAEIELGVEDLAELDRDFPPPTSKRPLAML